MVSVKRKDFKIGDYVYDSRRNFYWFKIIDGYFKTILIQLLKFMNIVNEYCKNIFVHNRSKYSFEIYCGNIFVRNTKFKDKDFFKNVKIFFKNDKSKYYDKDFFENDKKIKKDEIKKKY